MVARKAEVPGLGLFPRVPDTLPLAVEAESAARWLRDHPLCFADTLGEVQRHVAWLKHHGYEHGAKALWCIVAAALGYLEEHES